MMGNKLNIIKINIKDLVLFINFIILLFLFKGAIKLPLLVLGAVISLIIFIIPGLVFMEIIFFGLKKVLFERIFWWLGISTIVLIMGIGIHVLLGITIGSISYSIYILLIMNTIFIIGYIRNKRILNYERQIKLRLIATIVLFALILVYFVIYVIPPLQDNTLTTQSTAYGLSRHFIPKAFTDRYLCYEFAHPPLLHFYTAASIFLAGNLGDLKYYYDYANRCEELFKKKPVPDETINLSVYSFGNIEAKIKNVAGEEIVLDKEVPVIEPNKRLAPVGRYGFIRQNNIQEDYIPIPSGSWTNKINYDVIKKGEYWKMAREVYSRFYADPHLFFSRLPNIFFVLISCWALYTNLYILTNSMYISIFGLIVFISIPEVVIRAVGGSYTSAGFYFILMITYFYITRQKLSLFIATSLAALTDHKLLMFIPPLIITEWLQRDLLKKNTIVLPAIAGFFFGTALFWIYGISINKEIFFLDHLRYHFLNRILHIQDLGYADYPNIGGLWLEFIKSLNLFISFSVLAASFIIIFRLRQKATLFSLICFIFGASVFSFIDWRSTKHLILLTPFLIIVIFSVLASKYNIKKLLIPTLCFGIILNIWRLLHFIYSKDMTTISNIW